MGFNSAFKGLNYAKNPSFHIPLYSKCTKHNRIRCYMVTYRRSQWPRSLRRRSAAARLLRSGVRIPQGAWMFVCCDCRVLSGRGLYDELITRPEESYRLWCVVVCDLETSRMRRPSPALGRSATAQKKVHLPIPPLNEAVNTARNSPLKRTMPFWCLKGTELYV